MRHCNIEALKRSYEDSWEAKRSAAEEAKEERAARLADMTSDMWDRELATHLYDSLIDPPPALLAALKVAAGARCTDGEAAANSQLARLLVSHVEAWIESEAERRDEER